MYFGSTCDARLIILWEGWISWDLINGVALSFWNLTLSTIFEFISRLPTDRMAAKLIILFVCTCQEQKIRENKFRTYL